jgi:predicted MFS family arabinose efflux permease
MSVQATIPSEASDPREGWGAVYAMTLCVSALIASEFLPVSLLTPIARDLGVTEGQAGQAIAVSGAFAVITSLLISSLTRGIDRRHVLLGLTTLMVFSGLMVAFAPNAAVFMAGRALVGVVVGGFWSMSAATVMRLVREDQVPRALNLLNGGNALATTIAAPLGAYLGQYIGWRGAFFLVVPLGVLTLAWQYFTLPALPAGAARARTAAVFGVLRRPAVAIGMLAVAALFAGRFAVFTYLRPFLETVTRVSPSTLSLFLLLIGGAGLVGSILIGGMLTKRLRFALAGPPLAMAALAVALSALGASPLLTAGVLILWGLISTPSSAAWWTWLSKTMPENAEAGGGLMVAVIQLAITLGAALGGLLVDTSGYAAAFLAGAVILLGSAALTILSSRTTA